MMKANAVLLIIRHRKRQQMPVEFFTFDQGSPEWHEARRGIPTASRFSDVLAKGEGKTRMKYMRELAGEIITGTVAEGYKSAAMERGNAMEAEARAEYEFMTDTDVQLVGFARNGRVGASPDGLIGDGKILEIKTKEPHLLIEAIERGALPPDHRAQVQGCLWVTERKEADFIAYWPKMPSFIMTVKRDEEYIANLAAEIMRFTGELDAMVDRIRNYKRDV